MHSLATVRRELRDIYANASFECGEGWADLLYIAGLLIREEKKRHSPCEKIDVRDVKEKFGELRIIIFNGPDPIYEYIEAARLLSLFTCETCGTMTRVFHNDGLVLQPCAAHAPPFRPGLSDVLESVKASPDSALKHLQEIPETFSSFAIIIGYLLNTERARKSRNPVQPSGTESLPAENSKDDFNTGRYLYFLSKYRHLTDCQNINLKNL